MKKNLKIIGLIIIASLIYASCSNKKTSDIKISELNTACDYIDAMNIMLTEALTILDHKNFKDIDIKDSIAKELEKNYNLALKAGDLPKQKILMQDRDKFKIDYINALNLIKEQTIQLKSIRKKFLDIKKTFDNKFILEEAQKCEYFLTIKEKEKKIKKSRYWGNDYIIEELKLKYNIK